MLGVPPADALVLLHAFPLGAGMWTPQTDAFPGWRVLAPAFPGFDDVPPVAAPSMAAFVEHVWRVLDEAGVARAVLCGVSMGGYAAFEAWRQAPGRVAGLVLADTRAEADTPEGRQGRMAMREALASQGPAAVADAMLPKMLGAGTLDSESALVARVRGLILGQSREGIDGAIQALMTRPDSGPTLATITVPVLALAGEDDVLTPPADAQRIADGIPGAACVRLAGAGHMSNLERPDAFNDAVGRFLETIRSS
jgi:3-oxoadipate enol-lactonase